ncbi:MAG: DUF362 domain-containing protein [Dehalococcoidales bacterium]|nr:DUF362 domain-containing protein [Dehalococcoidales bacterium]
MEKSRVALVRCSSYDDDEVYLAVKRGLDILGGIQQFVKSGEKIVIKPNVLVGFDPSRCITTHPAVFKAAGKLLQQAGAAVYYGDSPAIGGCEFNIRRARLKQAADEAGFIPADFDHGRLVSHSAALICRQFILAEGVLATDGLVSLPKLKTHGLTRFTGAVKNQFGCIPGQHKREFHIKMPDLEHFAAMLVDINTFIRPRFYVMDGITAMEGNGPHNGSPRQMNVLLISSDPVALDAVACKLIDLNPEYVPTSKPGEKSGLGTYHFESIEVTGDDIDPLISRDFRVVRKPVVQSHGGRINDLVKNSITSRPEIDPRLCNSCGTCIEMCPVGNSALDWKNKSAGKKIPAHNYSKCIRCYCCQEICPSGAISIKTPLLGRLLLKG